MAESATPASGAAPADPFPTERLMALVRRLPRYVRLAWRLGRDPRLCVGARVAVMGAAAYLASPIDLVPGIIPVAGQLDDAAVALLALRFALRGLPQPRPGGAPRGGRRLAGGHRVRPRNRPPLAAWIVRRGGRLTARRGRRPCEADSAGRAGWCAGRAALRQVDG